jgi:soluble lytic murein transglycosylase-like protein
MLRTSEGLLPVGIIGRSRSKGSVPIGERVAKPVEATQFGGSLRSALSRVNSRAQKPTVAKSPSSASRSGGATGPGPTPYDSLIQSAAKREGVDEELVKAVVQAESGFNARAVSPVGAKGLMQLMDGTARSLGVKDSFDPAANISGGVKFLRSMMDRFGSVPLALAAYNAGPGAVEKYGGVPPYKETQTYVDRVLQLQQRYEASAAQSAAKGGADGGRATV